MSSDKNQKILRELLKLEGNDCCADCGKTAPTWASWSLGIFLCMECAGLHRELGVHISRVKSISLDSWTDEQVMSMRQFGNKKSNEIYLQYLPKPFVKPTDMKEYIRRKYEKKEWHITNNGNSTFASSIGVKSDLRPIKGSPGDIYSSQLAQLDSMGFKNRNYNLIAIEKAKGDINRAIEDIVAHDIPPDHSQSAAYQQSLRKFKAMGFTNESLLYSALDQAKGNEDMALDIIIANQPKTPVQQPSQAKHDPFIPAPQGFSSNRQVITTSVTTSGNNNSNNNNNKNKNTLISFDDDNFGGTPTTMTTTTTTTTQGSSSGSGVAFGSGDPWSGSPNVTSASAPAPFPANTAPVAPKPTKEDILSLYNKTPAGAVPLGYAPTATINPYNLSFPTTIPNTAYGVAYTNGYQPNLQPGYNTYSAGTQAYAAPNPFAGGSFVPATAAPQQAFIPANPYGQPIQQQQQQQQPYYGNMSGGTSNPFLTATYR